MDGTTISRGFRSRRQEQTPTNRLPPGQYVTTDFPVLSAGPTPQIKLGDWTFALQLGASLLGKWNWAEFEALPQTTIKVDIHCVTKWSKLDTNWQGVTFDDLLKAVGLTEPPAPDIMAHCDGGYTTNVPVADLIGGKGMITTRYEGLPIPPAHGGPARLLAPSPREADDSYSSFTVVLIQKSRRRHLSSRTRCNGTSRFPFACCQHLDP